MNSEGLPLSSVRRAAPSKRLYSEWLCRWTNDAAADEFSVLDAIRLWGVFRRDYAKNIPASKSGREALRGRKRLRSNGVQPVHGLLHSLLKKRRHPGGRGL